MNTSVNEMPEGDMPSADVPEAPRGLKLLLGVFLLGVLAVVVYVVMKQSSVGNDKPLPVMGVVPAFQLTDQDGQEFSSQKLAGKVWVANFIFTQCTAACPGMTETLREIQRTVAASAERVEDVRFVSFSVDPARDTPESLRRFGASYGADKATWVFLGGKPGEVVALSLRGFFLAAHEPSPENDANDSATHSDRFCLVDRRGQIRGFYRPSVDEGDRERLVADIDRLVAEAVPK